MSRFEVETRYELGVDRLMWGSDYPHFEGTWGYTDLSLRNTFSGIPTDGPMGGGEGEEMFRSLMVDEYGKSIEQRGGFGLAAAVQSQLLKHQELAAPTRTQ